MYSTQNILFIFNLHLENIKTLRICQMKGLLQRKLRHLWNIYQKYFSVILYQNDMETNIFSGFYQLWTHAMCIWWSMIVNPDQSSKVWDEFQSYLLYISRICSWRILINLAKFLWWTKFYTSSFCKKSITYPTSL